MSANFRRMVSQFVVPALLSGCLLSGCNEIRHDYLIRQHEPATWSGGPSLLQIDTDVADFVSVSVHEDPAARAAMSQTLTTAYQSAPPPAGAGAGEVAAAYLITTYLFKAKADSDMYGVARDKALGLMSAVTAEQRQERIATLLRDRLQLNKAIDFVSEAITNDCCVTTTRVVPQIQLSNDLRICEVKLNVTISSTATGDVQYRNSLVYASDPASPGAGMAYWTANDAERFYGTLDAAFIEMARMLEMEFAVDEQVVPIRRQAETLRYRNEAGTFYERGTLLWHSQGRIVLRDLRGNLRSFSGELL